MKANHNIKIACRVFPKFIILLLFVSSPVFAGEPDTLWSEDFEGNWANDWHTSHGTWEVGTPTTGPESAYRGDSCLATVLDGKYADNISSRFIRHTKFEIPPADQNPYLRFFHWLYYNDRDYFLAELSEDGVNWIPLSPKYVKNTGSNVWSPAIVFLDQYAGKTVQIAFYLYTQRYGTSDDTNYGSYIDQIALIYGDTTFYNPQGWDRTIGHWGSDGGSWEIGQPTSGPEAAHSPPNCLATNLDGNYSEPADSRFSSNFLKVPPADSLPALRFWHWYSFSTSDYGQVQIKIKDSTDWINLPDGKFTGSSSGIYTYPWFDLSPYAGLKIQIGFYFHSQIYGTSQDVANGWYIDDVVVQGHPNPIIGDGKPAQTAAGFRLSQNYPNPFNAQTKINFTLPRPAYVKIELFNYRGQSMGIICRAFYGSGEHQLIFNGQRLSSGLYYYKMQAGAFSAVRKMLNLK